jgi:uncharacterized membrane protein (DUF4010 family)
MDYTPFYNLGIALGLGLLVGLQRERSESKMAGIRTFPLVTMTGVLTAYLAQYWNSGWIVAAGTLSIALLALASNLLRVKNDSPEEKVGGQTTEVAAILMFLLGVYVVIGNHTLAIAIGATVALLLYLKPTLSGFVSRLGAKDTRAIMQFATLSLIILPVLPNETYGPYAVLNPREVWTMVVLIVGLSLSAYFIYKWTSEQLGTIAGGILGGLISSTATTVPYAKRTAGKQNVGRLAALVILIASTVSFIRILIEIGVVIPGELGRIAPPIFVVLCFMIALCIGFFFFAQHKEQDELPEPENPAQLKSALIFGALYAIIIFAVAVAKDWLGNSGLYAVAVISGLTDVDAITLSLSNTIKGGGLAASQGWKLILVAALSNMVFKAGLAVGLGSRKLAKYVIGLTLVTLAVGVLIVLLWPESWFLTSSGQ